MKEFWMALGLLCYLTTTQKSFATEVTYSLTENNLKASTDIHDNLGTLDIGVSPGLNLTQWASLLQTTKLSPSRAIIASNNKADEVTTAINEPIMPSLSSTLFVAHTRTNEIVNNVLSRNVLPEKLAIKYSSLNMPSVFFGATEHSSAISSKAPSVRKPEIALSTSEFSGIILPSWSVDKKYLPTSQAGDNSNGYSSQGALAESAFSNGFNSQTGQLSSSNSILGQISVDYDTSASTNDDSRLFTKGSMSLVKLPRTVLLSSQTIWKATDLNPRTLSQTTLLFSDKAGTSPSGATEKSDTKPSTLITTRKFSSISGMSHATSLAKMTRDESDVASTTFVASRTITTTTRTVASSLVHSDVQMNNSPVSSVVMASPSLSGKARVVSSLSPSTAMTVPITSHQGVPSSVNSTLSSRTENEFLTSTNSDEREDSSHMSFTTMHSSRISARDSATRDSASVSQDESALSEPLGMRSSSHISPPTERTTRLVSSSQIQSLHLTTREVDLEMTLADSANTFVTRTSSSLRPSSQASFKDKDMKSSLKAEDMTEFVTQSMVQSTNWIPFSASQEFSSLNANKNRKTWISGSSSLPQKRSSPVSDVHSFNPSSSSTILDKDKSVKTSSPKSKITSVVVISSQEESATSHRPPSRQVGATLNPTQKISSLSTVSDNVSSGTPTTTKSNSSHIKLPGIASSVIQFTIQKSTSLVSSVVMASPSVSSKARETSLQFSGAMTTISTPFISQSPFASWTNSKVSSKTKSESHPTESSRDAKNSSLMSSTYSSRESASISLDDGTTTSVLQEMRSSAVVSTLTEKSSSLAISSLLTESLTKAFADSTKTFSSRTSVKVRISIQATENMSSLSSPNTKPEIMTELPSTSLIKPTNWIPFSTSDKFSSLNTDSYNQTRSSSTSRFSGHEIRSSSGSEWSAMTSKLVVSSASYSQTSSQLPYKEVSAATSTRFILTRSSARMSSRSVPQKRSSTVSEDRNFSTSTSLSVTTLLDKSKSQTFTAVPAKSTKSEITSVVIVPVPEGTSSAPLGATVHPTQTRSTSATVAGNISTGPPTTTATGTGHFNLLIVVAIIPSIILCAFFAAVLFFRRSRKRRNKAVYSIKLEYADENNGFRKRCVNSRLDLSLKGIHIDLEFPNASSDRERRASYTRDSPRYSRGSTLSETQMRELQILSQECRENMEWISEVIAREMEASICGRIQPVNRESVYSVKEKENYEPSEKVIRRESSKRGRESVKWRVPVVQRRDSDDFDQRDSMCTDDTTLYPEDWKDGHERSTLQNSAETPRKSDKKTNPAAKETGDEVKLDNELRALYSNKKLDKLQSQDNEKKEKELQENIPLSVNLNTKKEDLSNATQGKRLSSRPQRSDTL